MITNKKMNRLFPLYCVFTAQLIRIGLGNLVNVLRDNNNNKNPKINVIEFVDNKSPFGSRQRIYGYDLNDDNHLDKVIKKVPYEAGRFGIIYHELEYYPQDEGFSELNNILKGKSN